MEKPSEGYRIFMINGIKAYIDKDEYWRIEKYKYYPNRYKSEKKKYLRRTAIINGKKTYLLLHREIMNTPKEMVCDHINGNTYDNRKKNLRNCTQRENIHNAKLYKTNKTGYKGVSINTQYNKYEARIIINGKGIFLGRYKNKRKAFMAYIKKLKELYADDKNIYVNAGGRMCSR